MPNKVHPVNIYKIARECGVVLQDAHLHSPTSKKPRHCYCKPTVKEIGLTHGEAHLRLVFQLLTGTNENSLQLYQDVLQSVSLVLTGHPELQKRSTLMSDFDAIDFGKLRTASKKYRTGMKRVHVMAMMLMFKLGIWSADEI
jgi:hypothetical protein